MWEALALIDNSSNQEEPGGETGDLPTVCPQPHQQQSADTCSNVEIAAPLGLFRLLEVCSMLIVVVTVQMCAFVQTHQIVHLKWVIFSL